MGVSELMKQDTDSRERIVLDTSTNFFVEAGAGSGKTTMLVRRMIAMVEAGIDVSRICAITFTKAAAGEFYARFQKMLAERSIAPTKADFVRDPGALKNPSDESRKRCQKALENIDLCFMGTIDSFCNMVLSEHPAEAGVPSNAAVISDDDQKAVFLREYTRMLEGAYGDDIRNECGLFDRINGSNAREAFTAGLKIIMDIRHTDIVLPTCPDSLDEAVKEDKAELLAVLKVLLSVPEAAYQGKHAGNTKAWAELEDNYDTLGHDWEEDIKSILYAINKGIADLRLDVDWWNKRHDVLGMYEDFFVPHESRNKIAWYEINSDKKEKLISKIEGYKSAKGLSFICKAADLIAAECKNRGELTFFDYLLYLRDMLKKDAEGDGRLIRHIYERHSYFLIDEFQDTNPMQAEIFFYLAAKVPVPEWRKCVPQPGSLFIVGDPKQSIYRFRNADVSAFLKVKALFTGEVGDVLYLTRNFRSTYRIREWFNSTFSTMLGTETEDQSRFEEIPLDDRPADDGTFGGVYYYDACTGNKDPEEMKDAVVVAGMIRQLVNNPDYLLPEKKDGIMIKRPIEYRDFMLITPGKPSLADYMKSFVAAGIPFYMEGKTQFGECPALVELVKLFEVAAKPNDKHILYKALTGKILKFHRSRIVKCSQMKTADAEGNPVSFRINVFADNSMFTNEKGFEGAESLAAALSDLGTLTRSSYNMSSAALFYRLLNRYRVFEKAGAENLEYVWFALELLRSKELDGTIASLKEGAEFLNTLIDNESGLERCISLKKENNRVHLANLHKVKGLEAPIVILARPTAKDHGVSTRTEQCEPVPKSWIFDISKRLASGPTVTYFKTDAFKEEEQREEISAQAEKLRLLYVAATRAKNVLLVGNKIKADGTPMDGNPWQAFVDVAEGDFAELPKGHPAQAGTRQQDDISDLYDAAPADEQLAGDSLEKSYKIERPSKLKTKGKTEAEEESEETIAAADSETAPEQKAKGRPDGMVIGTMVHRVMEALVSSRNTIDAGSLITETVDEYGYEYPEKEEEYKKILKAVTETVRNGGYTQEDGTAADILQEMLDADEVCCEVPFCYAEDSTLWNGVMDVVYRKNGSWHIVDYKTNADASDLDTKYQAQLEAYVKAFKATTRETADARTYHIDI